MTILVAGLALASLLWWVWPVRAADPQPYSVDLQQTGNGPLDSTLQASSTLIGLRTTVPVGPFALLARARADRERLLTALNSFGYYEAGVTMTVAGHALEDPELPATLDGAKEEAAIRIRVAPGPLFHLRHVELIGAPTPAAQAALQLQPGAPAVAADVLAAQSRMLDALRNAGYPLAKVEAPVARLAPADRALDVTFDVEPGPRAALGPIAITGLQRVDEDYVRRRLLIHQGQPFDPREIDRARQDLAAVGVFSTVTVDSPEHLDATGQLPITVRVVEAKRHIVSVNAAYSTDLGFSAGVTWSHRNLFGRAERLDLSAAVTQIGGTGSVRPGYDVSATLTQPDVFFRDLTLISKIEGLKESLDAYDRTALLGGETLQYKFTPELTGAVGLQAQQSRVSQEGVTRDYTLLQVPITAADDTTGVTALLDPTHGWRLLLSATPTASLRTPSTEFVILRATGSAYVDFGTAGRSVVAVRAVLGSIRGASTFQLPPDQRLYAGGTDTVRGYRYQSVGPKFQDYRPVGGTELAAVSAEFRQRIGESFGAAVFIDAGEVTAGSSPFGGQLRAGAGAGIRYYTPFGPIRADFALPLNRQRRDDAFEIYVGLGQAF